MSRKRHYLIVAIFILSITFGAISWIDLTIRGSLINNDFTQDYLAAYALRHRISIYGTGFTAISTELFGFEAKNYHPPFNALIFLPFSYLPYRIAFAVWNFITLIGFGILITCSLRLSRLESYPWLLLSSVLLLWKPVTSTVWLGQLSIFLALLITLGFSALLRGKDRTAGLLFACATLIKFFPGFLLLYLIHARRWRCALTYAGAMIFGLFISLYVIGWKDSLLYFRHVLPEQTHRFGSFPFNISIEGMVRTIFGPNQYFSPALELSSSAVKLIVGTIALAIVGAMAMASLSRRGRELDMNVFAFFCVTMLLVSPLTWPHTCVILLLPLALLFRDGIVLHQRHYLRVAIASFVFLSLPDPEILHALTAFYSPQEIPWYTLAITKTGFFSLCILWITFRLRLRIDHASYSGSIGPNG